MAKEKNSFEESLRRFQEKGAALKAALETAQHRATGNVAALKEKHQVGTVNGDGSGAARAAGGGVQHSNNSYRFARQTLSTVVCNYHCAIISSPRFL